ncbi:hypothetical protein CN391_18185 [Bacillus anthracis]|nr:hypothetical protein CN391_18185 [Bacillus anthracis]
MVLLCSVFSYIFERRVYQLCFQTLFYVFLGMLIISRDSHIVDESAISFKEFSAIQKENKRLKQEVELLKQAMTIMTLK